VTMQKSPPAGEALLAELRGLSRNRPSVDASLAARIRDRLEVAASDAGATRLPEHVIVRISKDRVRQVLTCEAKAVVQLHSNPSPPTPEMVLGKVMDLIFAQVVTGFEVGAEPIVDALAASDISGDDELRDDWNSLSSESQEEVRNQARERTVDLIERWPLLPTNALTRLQDRIRIELASGSVVLTGRLDLVLGVPAPDRAGVTLVDIKSGRPRHDDRIDAEWYALLELLRAGVQPFQSGSYYLTTGAVDLKTVDEDLLERATQRLSDAMTKLVGLAIGSAPTRSASPLCSWCPLLDECEIGLAFVEEGSG